MASLTFDEKKVPFLLSGAGTASVDVGLLDPELPLDPNAPAIFKTAFSANGTNKAVIGTTGSVKLGVSSSANLAITSLFPRDAASAQLLGAGLKEFFAAGKNSDKLLLVFDTGARVDGSSKGTFTFGSLSASTSLEAGAQAGFTYFRAFDRQRSLSSLLEDFFTTIRLPGHGSAAPEPGESIALRYGGYLKVGVEVSSGFKLAGSKSLSLGEMALSEKYDLSILGKVGLTAGVAGEFSIVVTADSTLPGWARVTVHRHRSSSLAVAADVNVGFNNKLTNLPQNPQEFLGAVLGVNAKSFLNVFNKALELSDAQQFEKAVDSLAKSFIEEFTGNAFAQLKGSDFANTLDTLSKAVNSHSALGDRAVTLFDRYFDRLPVLETFVQKIAALKPGDFATLRKGLDAEQWNILSQLTDGDPFGFLINQVVINRVKVDALTELKKRASSVLDLIKNPGGIHNEIRRTVELAHTSFGIDRFLVELARLDTPDKLKAVANQKLGMFVTRLLGELDSSDNFRKSFDRVHAVLAKIDGFGATLFNAFRDAANSSWKLALHAQYSRATDTDALVDVSINMATAAGRELMQSAGKGDFIEIVTSADTDLVRVQKGMFTHKTTRESSFRVNISGWHLNYQYAGFDRVITNAEQSLVPSDQGIRVDTTVTLTAEKDRRKRDESTHINFLLRALGESKHVVRAPSANTAFLIDTLQSLSAKYEITFEDGDTSLAELAEYLTFAHELGFRKQGATVAELEPVLPKAGNGGLGKITAKYEVRFGEAAVNALLSRNELSKQDEDEMRRVMRRNLRTNYLKGNTNRDVAIAYSTPEVYKFYLHTNAAAGGRFVDLPNVTVTLPDGEVTLDRNEIRWLDTLYQVEDKMIGAIRELYKVLGGAAIDPREFEKKLGKFASAMKAYDDFDQAEKKNGNGANSIFILFDALVRLSSDGGPANASMLTLTSDVSGTKTEKIFLSDAAVETPAVAQAAG